MGSGRMRYAVYSGWNKSVLSNGGMGCGKMEGYLACALLRLRVGYE